MALLGLSHFALARPGRQSLQDFEDEGLGRVLLERGGEPRIQPAYAVLVARFDVRDRSDVAPPVWADVSVDRGERSLLATSAI